MSEEMIVSLTALLLSMAAAAWVLLTRRRDKPEEDPDNIYSSRKAEKTAATNEALRKASEAVEKFRK